MNLKEILVGLEGIKARGNIDLDITNVDSDSRNIKESGLFIAIRGFEADGHEYIETAIKQGATAVVLEEGVNAEIIKKDDMGIKRLAYEIRKNTEGHYFIYEFQINTDLSSKAIAEIERFYRITDEIMKYVVVKQDN